MIHEKQTLFKQSRMLSADSKMDMFLNFFILALFAFNLNSGVPTSPFHRPNVRVYGGDNAKLGQFPFIVSINISPNRSADSHWCGASVINENWILTAAHCTELSSTKDFLVLTGTTSMDAGGTFYNTSKVISHPGFNLDDFKDDIALIKIEGAFEFGDLLQTIEIGEVSGNESVTVIGWGATEDTVYFSNNELKYASLTALSDEDCTKASEGADYIFPRGPGQVCALAGEGVSPCWGDSGGPLVFNGSLIGIVSYATSPCAKGFPDVYTRAAYYIDWINDNIKNLT